ncbi:MAG: creatininase family protein [Bacteroidales bacterium]|nr:creatininase family protein [Bacteroidales bacterium]MCF8402636.1 creatininase family protein [Bacteroidales bacterium]
MKKIEVAGNSDPLEILEVIDELIVGPVEIKPDKISMPYTVINSNGETTLDLEYKFEEEVFDPSDGGSQNLASMMGVQVAFNYGLFCKKITFKGLFDNTDKRFILDMMENTSREIYVIKLLHPNPFLIGNYKELPLIKQKKYTRAKVEFINQSPAKKLNWHFWETDKLKHCILSSGGKDSLLSYGLINEIGKEAHPIFVNESGRHWFTALNSYRYFKQNVPDTSRVWTNSDRLFNWMLRNLSFIRKDFNTIRADDYPIRLWTVAVFSFGVLPLMKKRGLSRLLIGDEYDSTQKKNYKGITHYSGLFDQSKYFDEVLSRYYLKKGWAINQFSILRPLSEILIEKILAKRYPELQQHQISCHASHQKEDRIYPCGKCEKCRRIVGMLKAVDEDPERCGYTPEQINQCLHDLMHKNIKQIGEDAKQLYFMLSQKGLLSKEGLKNGNPETLKLRFDNERSPINAIPTDLRKKIYTIFNAYADGVVQKRNGKWEEIDISTDPVMETYYPFEHDPDVVESFASEGIKELQSKYLWAELTWPEAEEILKHIDIALLPVGAIEQHGPHLPLDVDSFDADYLARRVAEACSEPRPLVLPLIPYGVSYHHNDFKGTISVSNEALANIIYEIGMSLARNGIKKLIIINGHGDNSPTLRYAAQRINKDARIFTCVDTGETSDFDIEKITETKNDVHAGETETSTSLATRPNLVKMELAEPSIPNFSTRYLNFSSVRGIPWYAYTKKISESGVMGDPTKATVEKGEKIWEIMIAHLVVLVEDLKTLTLDEIFQKDY